MSVFTDPYQDSYPPSLWAPVVVPATGAIAGLPGQWTPPGSQAPATVVDLIAGVPNAVTAAPAGAWSVGQYMQTATAGAGGQAHWSGTAWVVGVAAADEPVSDPEPEPDPVTYEQESSEPSEPA